MPRKGYGRSKECRRRGTFFVFQKVMFSKTYWFILSLPVIVILLKFGLRHIEKAKPILYKKKDSVLTEAERVFFATLREAIGDRYDIFPQVSLLEILSLPDGLNRRAHYSALNKIQAKHIDFLLCEKETTRPLVAIELDDSSHNRVDRIARDNFLNEAFASAGLPLLHIKTSSHYNPDTIQADIKSVLANEKDQA